MTRLSRVWSNKLKKTSNIKSTLVDRMTSHKIKKQLSDEVLLGNMFIKCIAGEIVDVTEKHEVIVGRTKLAENILAPDGSKCMKFDGDSTNINIPEDGTFCLSMEDFTIDWWEYKLPTPKNSDIPTTQYSFYKNSSDRKQPIAIKSTNQKSIYLSSDGDHWDIADDKFMGSISDSVWTHWAIARAGNNFYTFKNGILRNIWESNLAVNSSNGFFTIGSGPKGNNFYGYITNFRLVTGQTLWIDSFKPTNDELFY